MYGIRIELNGAEITAKVSRFEITARLDAYCRELSVDIADPDLYDSIDFSVLPESPAIEVFTRVGEDWVSQGQFFIEKPTFQVGIHRTETGLWGRSQTAALGPPFAVRFTKTWDPDTTFFTICTEVCTAAGLAWDPSYSAISDFTIHARTFTAENLTPVEIIQGLLELAYGEDAFLTTDRAGHVVIGLRDRAPSTADHVVNDPITVSISEEPEWPDFGNRIRITSTGSTSGYSVQVSAENTCLSGDGTTRVALYARVTDQEGEPSNNVPVVWSLRDGLVTLDAAITNTQSIVIFDEEVRAKSFYELDLKFPPALVRGIFAYKDTWHSENFAEDGVEIDGNTVSLSRRLDYCDQLLRVTYVVDGVAVNWATAGAFSGTERVTADVSGQAGLVDLYIDNPCNCPPSITLSANPTSLLIGESSSLLAYVEIGGAPVRDGRLLFMSIDSSPSHGKLEWTRNRLGQVAIKNELCQARNEIAGVSQTQIQSFPASVTGVWLAEQDEDGNRSKTGENLYASHEGKLINLSTNVISETELLVDYVAMGAVTNIFDGLKVGTDKIRAFVVTSREAPAEASTNISVSKDDNDDEPKDPEDCCNEGLCVGDGTPCDSQDAACDEGLVYGFKDGVEGCHPSADLDVGNCDEGKVFCRSGGNAGCFSPEECDTNYTDGGTGKRYGFKEGQAGCWLPGELDLCAGASSSSGEEEDDPNVMCMKSGIKGCYPVSECDSSYGATDARECPGGTVCCEDAVTGEQGCWAPGSCKAKDPGGHDPHDKDPKTVQCRKADGSMVTCTEGSTCCEKGGVKGCHPSAECDDGGGASCNTTSCQENPTEECLQARFGGALAKGCSCTELCEQELSNFGTTQANDGSSYRPLDEIVTSDYGLQPGTPEFDEKFDELKTSAVEECRSRCGDCDGAPDLAISGSDAVTAPGGYQYTASGGLQPHTWEVSGTGASIDDSGYLTLAANACGSFTVTVRDSCGATAEFIGRVTNHGQWVSVYYNASCRESALTCALCGGDSVEIISGDTRRRMSDCTEFADESTYGCTEYFTPIFSRHDGATGQDMFCAYRLVSVDKWQC